MAIVLFSCISVPYTVLSADSDTNTTGKSELSLDQVCVLLHEKRARLKPLEEARRRQAGCLKATS